MKKYVLIYCSIYDNYYALNDKWEFSVILAYNFESYEVAEKFIFANPATFKNCNLEIKTFYL